MNIKISNVSKSLRSTSMTIKSTMTQRSLKALEKITGAQLRLGHLLAAIRQAEEMTVTAFAQKLSISKQYLCGLEHHRNVQAQNWPPPMRRNLAILLNSLSA